MPRVAIVTCAELPDLDPDDRLVAPALAQLGIDARPVAWDDPAADWGSYDLVLLRNPWDYVTRREEFVDWARSRPQLVNPADVVAWNTDKRYLAELADAGLPVVPTRFLRPGDEPFAPDVEAVVKPAVSAGARDTERCTGEAARAHMAALLAAGRATMVQPYLEDVEDAGETALIYLDGEFSHAIRKGALLAPGYAAPEGLFQPEDIRAREPAAAERDAADAIHAWTRERFGTLLYCRVDLVPGEDGPLLLELELTEPSLFLGTAPGAADRLAAAIARRVRA